MSGADPKYAALSRGGDVIMGQQDVTTSAVVLASVETYEITVKNMSTSTVPIYLGGVGVTAADGFEIEVGAAMTLTVSNVNKIYVMAESTGSRVCWIGKRR